MKGVQQVDVCIFSPGAVAVWGDGAETPAVCCVPLGCACGLPAGLYVVGAAWLQRGDQPRQGEAEDPLSPTDLRQGPLAGCAAPLAAHTPSAESWGDRLKTQHVTCSFTSFLKAKRKEKCQNFIFFPAQSTIQIIITTINHKVVALARNPSK